MIPLLRWLRGKPKRPTQARPLKAPSRRRVAIVGESHYQPAIRAAVAAYPGKPCPAALFLEPENQHDPNAVAVHLVTFGKVGHLSREDALDYGPALRQLAAQNQYGTCPAFIFGGEPGKPSYGVWLQLANPRDVLG